MANSALYSNMVIDTWDALYSEPLTAFPQLRGFDAHVITKVGAIKAADTRKITKVPSIKTTTSGSGSYIILSNNSVDAIQAVNKLLKTSKTVGMITTGTNKGDFLVKKTDFNTVKNDYVLVGKAVSKMPAARVIKKAVKVYIPGRTAPAFTTTKDGKEYGIKTVSYTHLDVYKRQSIKWVIKITVMPSSWSSLMICIISSRPLGSSIAVGSSKMMHSGFMATTPAIAILCFCPPAVSYTHLDVYKRQFHEDA